MEQKPKTLLLPISWREMFSRLSDREAAALIRAAFDIAAGEAPPEKMPPAAFAFLPQLEEFIKSNQENYTRICKARRDAANSRWESEKATKDAKNANASACNAKGCKADASEYEPIANDAISNSNSNSNININPPLPPLGGLSKEGKIKSRWLMREIGRFYRRKIKTPWSKKEIAALVKVVQRPEVLAECREIMRLYRGGYEFYRREAVTLLNNWAGELDKARNYQPPRQPIPGPGNRSVGSSQPPPQYQPNQRGKGGLNYG